MSIHWNHGSHGYVDGIERRRRAEELVGRLFLPDADLLVERLQYFGGDGHAAEIVVPHLRDGRQRRRTNEHYDGDNLPLHHRDALVGGRVGNQLRKIHREGRLWDVNTNLGCLLGSASEQYFIKIGKRCHNRLIRAKEDECVARSRI